MTQATMQPLPAAGSLDPGDPGSPLQEIERGLTTIVRWGNLPKVRERFAGAAGVALDRSSYSLLFRLNECGPSRLSDLAQKVALDLSTASRQVHFLEASGLVQKETVEEDRRAALLSVTAKGHDLIERILTAKRAFITEILSDWTPEEQRSLGHMLTRLADAMVAFGCRER